jgi:putative FmdB family regulatory protein
MPIYEYKCAECEHQFEIYQDIKDIPLIECPNCNKNMLERLIFAVFGSVKKVTTLGQLAEKNTKQMGSKLDTEQAAKSREAKAKKKQIDKINKMTTEQKIKYVTEG